MPSSVAAPLTAADRLREAEAHLAQARARLDAAPPDYGAALENVLGSLRSSFRAAVSGYGGPPAADASLDALAERAVRCDSVLKTVANRALRLADRAPAIQRAARLSVHDREDVTTGWYTARNLYETVAFRLRAAPPASAA